MRDLAATTSTMSSREIAELTGKDHKHVLTDVRNMCESLKIQSAEFSAQYKDSTANNARAILATAGIPPVYL